MWNAGNLVSLMEPLTYYILHNFQHAFDHHWGWSSWPRWTLTGAPMILSEGWLFCSHCRGPWWGHWHQVTTTHSLIWGDHRWQMAMWKWQLFLRKKAFVPLTYMAEECEPVRRHNNVELVILIVKLVASFVEADHVAIPMSNLSRKGQPWGLFSSPSLKDPDRRQLSSLRTRLPMSCSVGPSHHLLWPAQSW